MVAVEVVGGGSGSGRYGGRRSDSSGRSRNHSDSPTLYLRSVVMAEVIGVGIDDSDCGSGSREGIDGGDSFGSFCE